jgi:hypothetical protein
VSLRSNFDRQDTFYYVIISYLNTKRPTGDLSQQAISRANLQHFYLFIFKFQKKNICKNVLKGYSVVRHNRFGRLRHSRIGGCAPSPWRKSHRAQDAHARTDYGHGDVYMARNIYSIQPLVLSRSKFFHPKLLQKDDFLMGFTLADTAMHTRQQTKSATRNARPAG